MQQLVLRLPFPARRIILMMILVTAFLVMASVFSPDRTRAGGIESSNDSGLTGPDFSVVGGHDEAPSTNPHEGLRSLGSMQSNNFTVHIYSTQLGARYSVYDHSGSRLLGTLLTVEQVNQMFPELQLPGMDFSASENSPLMLADPVDDDIVR